MNESGLPGREPGSQAKPDQQNRNDRKHAKRKNKAKNRQRSQPVVDPSKFWGDPEALPEPIDHVNSSPDVTAVVCSLGRVPIPPHETAAEHSFQMVYRRAAILASALAKASGLDEDEHNSR